MIHPTLADGESFVEGRSGATAKALLEAAGDRGSEVRTTSFGYIVPSDLVPEGVSAITNADTAAVITQPGTSTNVDEVWNVGGRPKATEKSTEGESDQTDHGDDVDLFDPSNSTIDEVKTYLDGADETERQRVLDAETAGKGRKGILDLATTSEEGK